MNRPSDAKPRYRAGFRLTGAVPARYREACLDGRST